MTTNLSSAWKADDPSKRQFLAGTGAALALSAVPWTVRRAWAQHEWNLIVIGAGTAGLPAALFAAERGAKVLIIETSQKIGGTLLISSGQISAAGTKIQARKGIEDSPEIHFNDVWAISRQTVEPDVVRVFTEHAASTLDYLTDSGYEVAPNHPIVGGGHEPYSVPRYQWGPEGGLSIFKALMPNVQRHMGAGNIRVLLGTSAVDLIQNTDGAVRGVVASGPDGRRTDYYGRYVALTAGGYCANAKMFEDIHSMPLYGRLVWPYNDGSGVALGISAGGYLRGAEKLHTNSGLLLRDDNFPSPADQSVIVAPQRRKPWELWVNVNGQRFIREDNPEIHQREKLAAAQPDQRFWIVFDQTIRESAPPFGPFWSQEALDTAFLQHPMFSSGNSLAELAFFTSVDEQGLSASVDAYNRVQAAGHDTEFDREHMPLPIVTPPFYAIRMQAVGWLSYAGLAVNAQLQVMREDGRAIPNLYAAGEIIGAGATTGSAIISGMMATPALTLGQLIGSKMIAI